MSDSRFTSSTNNPALYSRNNYAPIDDVLQNLTIKRLHQIVRETAENFKAMQKLNVSGLDVLDTLLNRIKYDSRFTLDDLRALTTFNAEQIWGKYYNEPINAYFERTPEKNFNEMTLKELHEFSFHALTMSHFHKQLGCTFDNIHNFFDNISNKEYIMNFEKFISISRANGPKIFKELYSMTVKDIRHLKLKNQVNYSDLVIPGIDAVLESPKTSNPVKKVQTSKFYTGNPNSFVSFAIQSLNKNSPLILENKNKKRNLDKTEDKPSKEPGEIIKQQNTAESNKKQKQDNIVSQGIQLENSEKAMERVSDENSKNEEDRNHLRQNGF